MERGAWRATIHEVTKSWMGLSDSIQRQIGSGQTRDGKQRPQASLVAQMVKNLPAMQEIQVPSLDWEDPLEKGRTTHSSILAWRIPWMEEPARLQSMGLQRVGHS